MLEVADRLSDVERDRAQRLRDPVRRQRFVTARGILREVLSGCVGVPSHQLEFFSETHGKPFLRGHPGLSFNLSHSGPWMMLAIHFTPAGQDSPAERGWEVGIDVERIRADWGERSMALARRFFAPFELAELEALAPAQQVLAVTRLWVCKEAYSKAKGLGLRLPMNSYAITGAAQESPRLQASTLWPGDPDHYRLCSLPAPEDHVAALVFRTAAGQTPRVILHHWPASQATDGRLSRVEVWKHRSLGVTDG